MNPPIYKTCRPSEGGSPACDLGGALHLAFKDHRTVEVRGCDAQTVYSAQQALDQGAQPASPQGAPVLEREYDLLIIGMNPGQTEDRAGYPFVGDSGRILLDTLVGVGFDLSRVLLTNAVKCRSPKNRRPSSTEKKACLPHLAYEIHKIRPKAIVLLGADALSAFRIQGGIFANRGKVIHKPFPPLPDFGDFPLIPTFHPAFFIHQPDPRAQRKFRDDLILAHNVSQGHLPRRYKPFKWSSHNIVKTEEQADQVVNEIRSRGFFSFDTESRSLPWWREPMLCISLCWGMEPEERAVVPIMRRAGRKNSLGWLCEPFWRDKDWILKRLASIFEDQKVIKAIFNAKYDILVLKQHAGIEVKGKIVDPMLTHHLLYEYPPHDLEYLSDQELAIGDYSETLQRIVGSGRNKKSFDRVPDHILWKYALADAYCTYRLACIYSNRLKEKPHLWDLYWKQSVPLTYAFAKAEWRGVGVDLGKVEKLRDQIEVERQQLLVEIRRHTWPEFNPSSPKQVVKALIQMGYGKQIQDLVKASGYSASQDKLSELKHEIPFAQQILDYRNKHKMVSNYVKNIFENTKDGRLRCSFKLHGTTSGRLAVELLHQIPRVDKKKELNFRDCFVAEPGYSFVYGDFSQAELWVYGILVYQKTGDRWLLDRLESGADVHKETGSTFFGLPLDQITEDNRSVAKNVGFGMVFGSEGYNIAKMLWDNPHTGQKELLTWDKINEGLENFHRQFPGAKEYQRLVVEETIANKGVCISVYGRERHFGDQLTNPATQKHAIRSLVNFTIQNPVGEYTKNVIVKLDQYLDSLAMRGKIRVEEDRFLNSVHDSLKFETKDQLVPWFTKVFKKVAETPAPELDGHALKCDIGVGRSWSEAEANSK